MSTVRVRFAPSPTGSLHIGSARTALFNFVFARHQGGVFVLRIEDTDMKRSLQVHEHSITRDLHWLGLSADEGPDVGGAYGPYRQSERAHIYEEGVLRLLAEGHAYRCFCSQERLDALKEDQLARGRMPKYDRRCLGLTEEEVQQRLAAGEQATVRFRIPQGQVDYQDMIRGRLSFSADVIGDFIIKRTDGGFSYNYAVVMDDMGMKITHVIRGEDHVTNTARQLLLFQAFGVEPPTYAHHSMIHAPDGGKLSKRHGATSIGEFRDLGYLPEAMVNYLALLGWHPSDERELFRLPELVQEFTMDRVSKSPAVFDRDKLNWLNGVYVRGLTPEDLYRRVEPFLLEAGISLQPVQREVVAAAIQSNLVTLDDAPEYAGVFTAEVDLADSPHLGVLATPGVDQVFELLEEALAQFTEEFLSADEGRAVMHTVAADCKEKGLKGKSIYMPLRVALTGRTEGAELYYLVAGLGRSRVSARLAQARTLM
ncbi:MAG: glutamate--tRNA ligase [Actinobacteria bacterium]|nr:glutamate--tRNA ligase [Actinomycetota bacterium]